MCRMNVVTATCSGHTVRCTSCWNVAENHVHFNVQNPTADSTARSREASLSTMWLGWGEDQVGVGWGRGGMG